MPQLAEEAQMMLRNLIPFLRYKYSDKIDIFFKADALQSAEGATWDPELKRVVCQADSNLDKLCDIEDDGLGLQEAMDFISSKSAPEQSTPIEQLTRPVTQAAAADAYYNETDSVSTLDTPFTRARGASTSTLNTQLLVPFVPPLKPLPLPLLE